MSENETLLLALVKTGLGFYSHDTIHNLSEQQLGRLYNLATEQAVIGLAMDGLMANDITNLKGFDTYWEWCAITAQIEVMNETQFKLVGGVYRIFASEELHPVIMKGPIVAQEYPNPLRRTPGDIDLYFTPSNGKKAVALAKKLQYVLYEESERDISFSYEGNIIEIHPYVAHQALQERYVFDRKFQKWCEDQITHHSRTITIGSDHTEIRIPSIMMIIVYEFYHLWIHFVRFGIGIRHICDWLMCIHNYNGKYDLDELNSLLKQFGLLGPWIGFSGVVVDYLGLPQNEMPFYNKTKKAKRVLKLVFKEGNMGHNVEYKTFSDTRLIRLGQKIYYTLSRYWKVGRLFPKDIMNFLPTIKIIGLY